MHLYEQHIGKVKSFLSGVICRNENNSVFSESDKILEYWGI